MFKTISFMNTESGAGKSTSIQLLASSLAQKFYRIVVIEASHEEHLKSWKKVSGEHGTWYPNAVYLNSRNDESFYKALDKAMKFGADFVLIDVGRESESMMALIARYSDLVIYPTDGGDSNNKGVRKSFSIVSDATGYSNLNTREFVLFVGTYTGELRHLSILASEFEVDNHDVNILKAVIRNWEGAGLGDIYGMHHAHLRNILYSNIPDQYRTKRALLEVIRDADAVTDEILSLLQPKRRFGS